MKVPIVPIGNSRGIRIPKSVIKQLEIEDRLEMEVHEKEIVLRPLKSNPRSGWKEAFAEMHNRNEDKLILENLDSVTDEDEFEWEW